MSDVDQIETQLAAEHEWTETRRAIAATSEGAMVWAAGLADRNAAEAKSQEAHDALRALASEIREVVRARRILREGRHV